MGLILPQKVNVKWSPPNIDNLINKGYIFTSYGDSIFVDVLDLSRCSNEKVNINCDFCNKEYLMTYKEWNNKKSDKYCCQDCLRHHKKTRDENGNLVFVPIKYRNKDWLYEQYIVLDREAQDIADECGINQRTLREWIVIFGLNNKISNITKDITKDILIELYVNQMKSTPEIGIMFNTTGNTIASLLRKYNIKIPSRSELSYRYIHVKGGKEVITKYARKIDARIYSSCRQRGISIDEFDGFNSSDLKIIRGSSDYEEWRTNVFKRDNYTCRKCGQVGGNLQAHHIQNFSSNIDKRFDINNGITFCKSCHAPNYKNSFHRIYGERNNTQEQLEEFLNSKNNLNYVDQNPNENTET